ncbi:hypothetical protein ACFOSC_14760 [Streptantibioticus rubrisoli]|uniref:SH3 domain-containing protein n=1 Tax=Streptantibioticus rubrisoli TaxID=1387313 RepID=A0ABT1P9P0_9ACTN|nr:hypothetical protein [Streptantibioticus rubrisoli]MCQ4042092.1 hypothetical protein [Streptantibioticus rubrisoli]
MVPQSKLNRALVAVAASAILTAGAAVPALADVRPASVSSPTDDPHHHDGRHDRDRDHDRDHDHDRDRDRDRDNGGDHGRDQHGRDHRGDGDRDHGRYPRGDHRGEGGYGHGRDAHGRHDDHRLHSGRHHSYRGRVIARRGLNVRQRPTTHSRVLGWHANGSILSIRCAVRGESIYGNQRWYLLTDGTWSSAHYVRTLGRTVRWCAYRHR